MPTVADIARSTGFRGSAAMRSAQPPEVRDLPVIDNGDPVQSDKNVSTSVDCYVAGHYIGGKGQRLEVVQRYTIYVRYSADSQFQTMQQIRSRIMDDFNARYGQFALSNIYVPELQAPVSAMPEFTYAGRDAWSARIQRASYDIQGEREKSRYNIEKIRRRYDL
jgi:hypothetical protein